MMAGATQFSWIFTATILLVLTVGVKCKRKFDGDFEFAEEDDTRIIKIGDKKHWIHDPNNELCRPLNCKKKELCLLEDMFTAVCVSKKELHKSGDIVIPKSRAIQQRRMRTEISVDSDDDDAFFDSEDDDDDQDEPKCQECPVVKPTFLCGNDNRTYSSPCRLEYHNCIHHTSVHIACKGFCPCRAADLRLYSKKMQMQRKKTFMGKMGHNHDITLTPRDFNYDNHHYQYLKYTKRGKDIANRHDNKHLSNKIMDKPQSPFKAIYNVQLPSRNTDCPSSSKPAMANRLLDWFSVVMMDAKHRRQHPKLKGHFPIGCQSEVRWMFGHLDSDSDSRLSLSELYGLEHDQNEPCLKPFLDGCDTDRFEYLLGLVGHLLKKREMYTALTSAQRLSMTLRSFAAGDSQDSLSFAYRCAQSIVSVILAETTRALVSVLKPVYVRAPSSEEEWRQIAGGFWQDW